MSLGCVSTQWALAPRTYMVVTTFLLGQIPESYSAADAEVFANVRGSLARGRDVRYERKDKSHLKMAEPSITEFATDRLALNGAGRPYYSIRQGYELLGRYILAPATTRTGQDITRCWPSDFLKQRPWQPPMRPFHRPKRLPPRAQPLLPSFPPHDQLDPRIHTGGTSWRGDELRTICNRVSVIEPHYCLEIGASRDAYHLINFLKRAILDFRKEKEYPSPFRN